MCSEWTCVDSYSSTQRWANLNSAFATGTDNFCLNKIRGHESSVPHFFFFIYTSSLYLTVSKEVSVEQWSRSCLKKTYRLLRIQEWNFDDYRSHCILGLHGGNHFQVIMYHTVSSKSYHLIVMSIVISYHISIHQLKSSWIFHHIIIQVQQRVKHKAAFRWNYIEDILCF